MSIRLRKYGKYSPCNIIDECYHLGALQLKKAPVGYSAFLIKGTLDHEAMKSALSASLEAHDKLKCILTLKGPSWRRWFQSVWEPREVNISDVLRFTTPQDLGIELKQEPHTFCSFLYQQTIDLSKEPGLKVFSISDENDTLLVFAFHHAVTDGRGAANFVETFIGAYNGIYFNRKIVKQMRASFTYFDNLYLPTVKENLRLVKPLISLLKHQYGSRREAVVRILPKQQVSRAERMVIAKKIEGQALESVMTAAKRNSVTFYDMLLAGLYYAVRRWNKQLGEKETGSVVLYTTVGLRRRDSVSIGNYVSGIHLGFTESEGIKKGELLRSIARKRISLLANKAHLVPLSLLSALSLVPIAFRKWLMELIAKRMRFGAGRQRATVRVANLGTLEVADAGGIARNVLGDALIERSYFFPADIDNVPSLGFLTYDKEVHLNMVALTSTFSYESGLEFLSLLVEELSNF